MAPPSMKGNSRAKCRIMGDAWIARPSAPAQLDGPRTIFLLAGWVRTSFPPRPPSPPRAASARLRCGCRRWVASSRSTRNPPRSCRGCTLLCNTAPPDRGSRTLRRNRLARVRRAHRGIALRLDANRRGRILRALIVVRTAVGGALLGAIRLVLVGVTKPRRAGGFSDCAGGAKSVPHHRDVVIGEAEVLGVPTQKAGRARPSDTLRQANALVGVRRGTDPRRAFGALQTRRTRGRLLRISVSFASQNSCADAEGEEHKQWVIQCP